MVNQYIISATNLQLVLGSPSQVPGREWANEMANGCSSLFIHTQTYGINMYLYIYIYGASNHYSHYTIKRKQH